MNGLFIKDLYIARSSIFITLVTVVVLGFGIAFLLEPSALLIVAPACTTTAVFNSIISDETSKWTKSAIIMPVTRRQIIAEKFALYLMLTVLGIIAALIPCAALAAFGVGISENSLFQYGCIGISISLLVGCISIPCSYRVSPDKAQIVFMLSYIVSAGIIFGLSVMLNLCFPMKTNASLALSIVAAISAVFLFVSYLVTVRMFQRKELS